MSDLGLAVPLVVAGYLAVWAGFSAVATTLQWALEGSGLLSAMMATTATWLGAVILFGAGLWQFAPLKQACLRYCRSPIGFLTSRWRGGRSSARCPNGGALGACRASAGQP